ncbi:hypothetical protein SAMN05661080_01581 [Modestobacter sp. DSM 44400]|uniref:hypothetical protein n=1 Tax=Modestobacter sp. DSM 44400 TaxID=1550230 RepID=UPI0008966643|nr:hypothetical protein [Modestobacter sp. DSM 44400]SDX88241.1 hypothetical protein SAMN05661080_01581 [Modestobacter sp. DSM 44400]
MAREIPEAVRAAAGLVATVLDETCKLPATLPGLPVRLIGLALQTSLRLQQQYSGLVARGDEVFTGLWGESEPGMATFDEDEPPVTVPGDRPAPRSSAFDRVVDLAESPADDLTVELSDEIVDLGDAMADVEVIDVEVETAIEELADAAPVEGALLDAALEELADGADDIADAAPLTDVLAFETLAAEGAGLSDAEVADLPADPPADAVTEAVDELAAEVDAELAAELPETVADDLADDLAADTVATVADEEVAEAEAAAEATTSGQGPAEAPSEVALGDVAPDVEALDDAAAEVIDLGAAEPVVVQPDVAGADALPGVTGANTTTADESERAPEQAPEAVTDEPEGGSDLAGSQAAGAAPVEGYDGYSIPTLRGRLRSFDAETVQALLEYEQATRARASYVTLLSNRLTKLTSSPA